MLWRRPPSVRSLIASSHGRCISTKAAGPLKILFCGSDEFSIASLRALDDAKHADAELVESIEVVHRPGKPTGRGLKVIREVPIKQVAASELSYATHEVDTFTGWTPPRPFDIIIAVSFGLFIPRRLLNAAKYGGLNVHPSLLPDLRGPAPIHHTLLKRRARTGVTVQTLHAEHFDHGIILAQTPPPGIEVDAEARPAELVRHLGAVGGQMLVHVLSNRDFVPPLRQAGWYADSGGPVDHAEKITPAHRYVDFSNATARDVLTRHRVLGDLWTTLHNGERVILHGIRQIRSDVDSARHPGLSVAGDAHGVVARTVDGELLEIQSSTCAGGKKGTGNARIRRILCSKEGDGRV